MNAKVETKQYRFDLFKWLLVVAVVAGAVVGNSVYEAQYIAPYRILGLLAAAGVALFIAVQTSRGNAIWSLLKAAQMELRKVVWPSRQEVNQTTLMVVAVVLIAALILWGLDSFLGWGSLYIIGSSEV